MTNIHTFGEGSGESASKRLVRSAISVLSEDLRSKLTNIYMKKFKDQPSRTVH